MGAHETLSKDMEVMPQQHEPCVDGRVVPALQGMRANSRAVKTPTAVWGSACMLHQQTLLNFQCPTHSRSSSRDALGLGFRVTSTSSHGCR